jgi:hypothetical protein
MWTQNGRVYAPASGANLYPLFNFTRFAHVALLQRMVRSSAFHSHCPLCDEICAIEPRLAGLR